VGGFALGIRWREVIARHTKVNSNSWSFDRVLYSEADYEAKTKEAVEFAMRTILGGKQIRPEDILAKM
jgi:hypothetical protein